MTSLKSRLSGSTNSTFPVDPPANRDALPFETLVDIELGTAPELIEAALRWVR